MYDFDVYYIRDTGWETKNFWHSLELGSLLHNLYKFHSPMLVFHPPGQIFTRIGKRARASFPAWGYHIETQNIALWWYIYHHFSHQVAIVHEGHTQFKSLDCWLSCWIQYRNGGQKCAYIMKDHAHYMN